ncbi:hypothetical protein [Winogradskyella sp. R77965]|uniref:hypothetical protein n=1 Tax=Winogradskyella sp. R77965 TaxID=3093872 RepID=UPI0037DCAC60
MKPNLHFLLALSLCSVLFTCSPEDNTNITLEKLSEFTFNGETYDLASAIIRDENTGDISINLFNKTSSEITSNSDLSDVTYLHFSLNDSTIQQTTYNQIEDYDISINSSVIDSEFNSGTVLLSDNNPDSEVYAQSGSVTVTNFTAYNIVFTFTFTRNDGQVIAGVYDGNYYIP